MCVCVCLPVCGNNVTRQWWLTGSFGPAVAETRQERAAELVPVETAGHHPQQEQAGPLLSPGRISRQASA